MPTDISLPAPAQRVVEAINAGDTDAFVGAFTPDGFVDDWGRVLQGADGIRSWANTDAIGAGARMTVLSAETEGDTTRVHFSWESSVFNGESDGIFVVEGDKLASFTIPARTADRLRGHPANAAPAHDGGSGATAQSLNEC